MNNFALFKVNQMLLERITELDAKKETSREPSI